jgi:hypothetical protein
VGTVVGTITASDADVPAQTLTYTVISGNESGAFAVNPSTGVITVADSSKLDYETTPTFNLMIRVSDSVNPPLSSSANVSIRLTNVNDPPLAVDDFYFTASGKLLDISAPGLLLNDSDPEKGLLQASLVSNPSHGTLTQFNANGAFAYQPATGYTGTDQFVYKVTDVGGQSRQATVTINVGASFTVTLPSQVWEGQGTYAGQGKITIPYPSTRDVIVSLFTNDADHSELSVPSTVTLPAGQTSVTFDVSALDDPDQNGTAEDGSQTITVTASADTEGFYPGSAQVTVRDNDVSYFTVSTVSSPQVAKTPIRVDVTARDAGGLLIEVYGGAGFFTANSNGANISGVKWENYVAAGETPPEQAFENGQGSFLVTLPSLANNVQLVVSDAQGAAGHKGYSNRFNVTYGSVSSFDVESVISPQWVTTNDDYNPIPIAVVAQDANGFVVGSYVAETEVTAWKARDGIASTIVISEIGDGTPDYIEIQNVTNADVNTSGWTVLANDPTNGDAKAVMAARWPLASVMAAGSVDYRSDDPTDASHYWGENITWGASTAKGWVMIIDDQFQIRDFVAWGYDAYTIESLQVDVGVTSVHIYDPAHPAAAEWFGDGIVYGGSSTLTLQRMANRDGNAAGDFAWLDSSYQAANPAIVLPFLAPVSPVAMSGQKSVSGITRSGTTAIANCADHGFSVGDVVKISGAERYVDNNGISHDSPYNGTFTILSVTADTFTYAVNDLLSPPATGTIVAFGATSTNRLTGFSGGIYNGGVFINEIATQVFLRVNDRAGHIGESNSFNVETAPVPVLTSTPGMYDASSSTFYLRNSNSGGYADSVFGYGPAPSTWIPISGDWNGDGIDTVGLYDPASSVFYLTNANSGFADTVFGFGAPAAGWRPISGDWNGDGIDTVGLYDAYNATFYLTDINAMSMANRVLGYGPTKNNWTPIAGNWDGLDGDGIGLYDPASSVFYLKNETTTGVADRAFGFGEAGWTAIAGDWNGDAMDSIGLMDPKTSVFYLRNTNNSGFADATFGYGNAAGKWVPVMGDWNGTASLIAAAESIAADPTAATPLDAGQVQPLAAAALDQWSGLGLSNAVLDRLSQVEFVVADLPGDTLGMVQGRTVYLDADAAGRGWFVDATPEANEEFVLDASAANMAIDPAAVDRMDLLTVVAHELGHVAGLEHVGGEDALMSETLARGVRRTAGLAERDALFALEFGPS